MRNDDFPSPVTRIQAILLGTSIHFYLSCQEAQDYLSHVGDVIHHSLLGPLFCHRISIHENTNSLIVELWATSHRPSPSVVQWLDHQKIDTPLLFSCPTPH